MKPYTFCKDTQTILEAEFLASPHFDERPAGSSIDLLVVHCISLPPGEFGGKNVEKLFLNQLDLNAHPYYKTIPTTAVSSHLYIDREGGLVQFVPLDKRAWHAGESSFGGRKNCNDFSIGVELEGTETVPYTEAQYQTLVNCTQLIFEQYPMMNLDRVTGHSDIAPNRKTDPGDSFDWAYFRQLLGPAVKAV